MVVVLPAPFGPQQAEDLAFFHREIDVLDGLAFAKGFVQVFYFNGFFHKVPPFGFDPKVIEEPHFESVGSTQRVCSQPYTLKMRSSSRLFGYDNYFVFGSIYGSC